MGGRNFDRINRMHRMKEAPRKEREFEIWVFCSRILRGLGKGRY